MTKIDYILDAVVARGCNKNFNQCNDFIELLEKKDFKDLVALELYECYFWEDRHEFDLQLLRELVDNVCTYLHDSDSMMTIRTGILLALPTVIIVRMADYIWGKLKYVVSERHVSRESESVSNAPEDSSKNVSQNPKDEVDEDKAPAWIRIKNNAIKIDQEFKDRDYVLSDEIEKIFDISLEEIVPLLKLCGFKCYFCKKRKNNKRSIWIRPGLSDEKTRKVLKEHGFRYR